MTDTQKEEQLKELGIKIQIRRAKAVALREAWNDIQATWLAAEKDCHMVEIQFARLSREIVLERQGDA